MNPEARDGFLKDEYLYLQNMFEDFDRRSLVIKGWMSAGSLAALAFAFGQDTRTRQDVWLVLALFSACFWYLEWRWKTFQWALGPRIKLIEDYFRAREAGRQTSLAPFQVYEAWVVAFRSNRWRGISLAFWGSVMMPYVLIIAVSVYGYLAGSQAP
jgi:hypothetical protein